MKVKLIHAVIIISLIGGFSLLRNSLEVNGQSDGLKKYENTEYGVSFFYPSEWGNPSDRCPLDRNLFCGPTFLLTSNGSMTPHDVPNSIGTLRLLDIHAIGFRVTELDKSSGSTEACNCSTLRDFLRWEYSISSHEDEIFINDNQTIIGKNYSAWQTETMSDPGGLETKSLFVYAINGNLGYGFVYQSPPSTFGEHFEGFKNMLKTVTFTPPMSPKEKTPSFLNSSQIP